MGSDVALKILKATLETVSAKYLAEKEKSAKLEEENKELRRKCSLQIEEYIEPTINGQLYFEKLGDTDHPSYIIGEIVHLGWGKLYYWRSYARLKTGHFSGPENYKEEVN